VLAYLFWHRPREGVTVDTYEHAQLAFHRSLARARPQGLRCSALFRIDELPWAPRSGGDDGAPARYEDWYLLDDYAALGVLNEAAVGRGHRSAHDQAARRYGGGTAALYALAEGDRTDSSLIQATVAIWVTRPAGDPRRGLGDLLGDGMDPQHASLWRRQLVLGPAPEHCLLVCEESVADQPAGVAPTRLPTGWSATVVRRQALWHG
jgi:hypothetical protein